jgi:hypothetical protein
LGTLRESLMRAHHSALSGFDGLKFAAGSGRLTSAPSARNRQNGVLINPRSSRPS